MISQNKNVRKLEWHLYVEAEVEGSELYGYNTEDDRSSVVSQASCRMDVTRLEEPRLFDPLFKKSFVIYVSQYFSFTRGVNLYIRVVISD